MLSAINSITYFAKTEIFFFFVLKRYPAQPTLSAGSNTCTQVQIGPVQAVKNNSKTPILQHVPLSISYIYIYIYLYIYFSETTKIQPIRNWITVEIEGPLFLYGFPSKEAWKIQSLPYFSFVSRRSTRTFLEKEKNRGYGGVWLSSNASNLLFYLLHSSLLSPLSLSLSLSLSSPLSLSLSLSCFFSLQPKERKRAAPPPFLLLFNAGNSLVSFQIWVSHIREFPNSRLLT